MKQLIKPLVCILALGFSCLSLSLQAQTVKGYIKDKVSGEPVPYANVYFANTLIGTTTKGNGFFKLGTFTPGKYTLTVSFVGYTTRSIKVLLEENQVVEIDILLQPETVNLPEVFVTADTSNWEYHFKIFSKYFLGDNRAANGCEIKNPKTLAFYHDKDRNMLYAHAREPIQIENKYLGYQLTYDMNTFIFNVGQQTINYVGIPRFSLLSEDEKKRWERHRLRVYRGSPRHFFHALLTNSLVESEFEVKILYRKPNPRLLAHKQIMEKINEYRYKVFGLDSSQSNQSISSDRDSLNYYGELFHGSDYVDSLGIAITDKAQLMEGNEITYQGWLEIIYKGQRSMIRLKEPVYIYQNGYYEKIESIFFDGHWGTEYTASTMLPLDFKE